MTFLPTIKMITDGHQLELFQSNYFGNSGLAVPMDYLKKNKVFVFRYNNQQIGGFVLGTGEQFRTIQFFARESKWSRIYSQIDNPKVFSELCCFWIDPVYRCKTWINLTLWFLMSLALKRHSRPFLLFGTCSKGLARLYGSTRHSVLVHKDRINKKSTFIFTAKRSICITGIGEIILKKIGKLFMVKLNWEKVRDYQLEQKLVSDESILNYFSERNKWQRIKI